MKQIENNEKDKNKSKGNRGGARPNSGRKRKKVGVIKFKQQLKDYLTPKEVEDFIKIAKLQARKDPTMLKFVLEQVFGKAPQSVNFNGNFNATIKLEKLFTELAAGLKGERKLPVSS